MSFFVGVPSIFDGPPRLSRCRVGLLGLPAPQAAKLAVDPPPLSAGETPTHVGLTPVGQAYRVVLRSRPPRRGQPQQAAPSAARDRLETKKKQAEKVGILIENKFSFGDQAGRGNIETVRVFERIVERIVKWIGKRMAKWIVLTYNSERKNCVSSPGAKKYIWGISLSL